MMVCEKCGKYFHVDDIEECPECGMELCPSCYEEHVSECLNADENYRDIDEIDDDIPSECPKCGSELVPSVDYAKNGDGFTKTLFCEECDYSLDVTDKFPDDDENNENDDIEEL